MEAEPSGECVGKVVDSNVALEGESYGHCVVEDVEAPVVFDDGKEGDVEIDLSQLVGEGFRREKNAKRDSGEDVKRRRARAITREGCKALMTVRKRENGRWYVVKLEKDHNHELVTPAMRHFLRSHKQDFDPDKSCSNSFSSPGLSLDASADVLADSGSFGKMAFAVQSDGNSQKGRNLQYNVLYHEAIKCAEEGMASDQIFKVALNALREARVKIAGAKRNAMKSLPQN
ncbi:unnamed protein product [Malus baccata var. baccata]